MIPELTPLVKRFEETHDALLDCLAQFPDDRFLWRPGPRATTAGDIVRHTARAEFRYARQIGGGPEEPSDLAVLDGATALAAVECGAGYARAVMETLRREDLDRVVADEWRPLGPRVEGPLTVLWFLEQMIRHKAYHLGQLWYLAMMAET